MLHQDAHECNRSKDGFHDITLFGAVAYYKSGALPFWSVSRIAAKALVTFSRRCPPHPNQKGLRGPTAGPVLTVFGTENIQRRGHICICTLGCQDSH